MDRIELSNAQRYALYTVIYIVTVVGVFLMLPENTTVDQYYEVGKPWNYDAMIAPMDFPIYKSEERIAKERDSLHQFLVPFMMVDSVEMMAAINSLQVLSTEGTNDRAYRDLLLMVRKMYINGVVSTEDKEWFESIGITTVSVIMPDFSTNEVPVSKLKTVSQAYNRLYDALKDVGYDEETIKSLRVSRFVSINLKIDKVKTDEALKELEAMVLPTSGMVVEGEKIIDKGEIVTERKAQVLNSLRKISAEDNSEKETTWWTIGADIILLLMYYALLWGYLVLFRPKIFKSARETLFLMLASVMMLGLFSLVVVQLKYREYIVPMAMLPLVVRVFFDSRTALYVHIVTTLAASMFVDNPAEFIIIELIAGMVAVLSLKDINNRKQLLRAALIVFVTYMLTFISLRLSMGIDIESVDWWTTGTFLINAICLLLTYGVIFLVEKVFGFLSDVSLGELANVNNPLINQFANKCPGTFQHVLQVGNLAEHVATKVGANPLLVRAGAMYHDLGKMNNPMVFTENRAAGINPLEDLTLIESSDLIIRHVEDGVKIAKKNGLPFQIIEFILTHHGTSKTRFFYNQWVNEHPGEEPPKDKFTYKGPKPRTKETIILMMADSIEAASRSLKEYNKETIGKLVENIVTSQIMDGQFTDAPITFRDLQIAKESFKEYLLNIYHSRVAYPEINDGKGKTPMQLAKEINISFPRRFTKR
ncbi:MAG: HDIG domain-containing protein [Paludibacteraceae bacterium]|nr:HDIG domain-containing protein [Paludibacteraceae bacterium]